MMAWNFLFTHVSFLFIYLIYIYFGGKRGGRNMEIPRSYGASPGIEAFATPWLCLFFQVVQKVKSTTTSKATYQVRSCGTAFCCADKKNSTLTPAHSALDLVGRRIHQFERSPYSTLSHIHWSSCRVLIRLIMDEVRTRCQLTFENWKKDRQLHRLEGSVLFVFNRFRVWWPPVPQGACSSVIEPCNEFNPFTPKFKKSTPKTFCREVYKWRVSENW